LLAQRKGDLEAATALQPEQTESQPHINLRRPI